VTKLFDIFLATKPGNMVIGDYDDPNGCVAAVRLRHTDGTRIWHVVLTRRQLKRRMKRLGLTAENFWNGLAAKWKKLIGGKNCPIHNLAGRDRIVDAFAKIRAKMDGTVEPTDDEDDVPPDAEYET